LRLQIAQALIIFAVSFGHWAIAAIDPHSLFFSFPIDAAVGMAACGFLYGQ
jgi:hypothetical protein